MKKVCFVCLGNICRSPMAEFVMKSIVSSDVMMIESRATSDWEHGKPIHSGTQSILKTYQINYDITKCSKQITITDFNTFDYIIGMDSDNVKISKRCRNINGTLKSICLEKGVFLILGTLTILKKPTN